MNARALSVIQQFDRDRRSLPNHGKHRCQRDLSLALGFTEGWGNACDSGDGYVERGWTRVDPRGGFQEGDLLIYHDGDKWSGGGFGHVGLAHQLPNGKWVLRSQMSGSWVDREIGQFSELLRDYSQARGVLQYDQAAGPPTPRGPGPTVQMQTTEQVFRAAQRAAGVAPAPTSYERRTARGPSGESMTVTVPKGQRGSYTMERGGVQFRVRYWPDGRVSVEAR